MAAEFKNSEDNKEKQIEPQTSQTKETLKIEEKLKEPPLKNQKVKKEKHNKLKKKAEHSRSWDFILTSLTKIFTYKIK
jgi:hypothetical protein